MKQYQNLSEKRDFFKARKKKKTNNTGFKMKW